MKRAFTIIELLVVIFILGILMGIVTTAMTGAYRQSREHKANATCICVEQGLATYRAQKDRWPDPIGDGSSIGSQSNQEGVNNQTDPDKYILTGPQVRQVCKALVDEAKKGNPLMDISGLYVSRDTGESGRKAFGMDFLDAIHGTEDHPKKMTSSEMYFGYPETSHGYFRRFKMVYSRPTDQLKVGRQ